VKQPFNAFAEAHRHHAVIFGILLGSIVLAYWVHPAFRIIAGFAFLAGLFTFYFFRDPQRKIPVDADAIVSPADGTIVAIEDLSDSPHYDGPCKRISIFLSVFNVHINRAPFAGIVESITYKPGAFKNAMRADTTDINEANTVRMQTETGPISVRQISGLIARRIVCRAEVGDTLQKGERFGMIKFGSRTELYLPPNVQICAKMDEKVAGGETILARFTE